MWKLNNILLNNQRDKEESTREIRKYLEKKLQHIESYKMQQRQCTEDL